MLMTEYFSDEAGSEPSSEVHSRFCVLLRSAQMGDLDNDDEDDDKAVRHHRILDHASRITFSCSDCCSLF